MSKVISSLIVAAAAVAAGIYFELLSIRTLLLTTTVLFLLLLLYYSILTIAGLYYRTKKTRFQKLDHYPSVDILIPAHNEGVVIKDTLDAMVSIQYPGQLNIYVLNDNSKDETAVIADQYDSTYREVHHILVPPGEPKGKSRVLNYGLEISDGEYFCVYDADNQPEPRALVQLVEAAVNYKDAAGAVGYVRTVNESKNLLTRMISIEFQVFQLLMQAGRWQLFKTGSLTGTNMLVKRSVIEELGGYDPYAIAEDAELTLRITRQGLFLPIVPHSVTWEQEPETMNVYIRQRTRWLQGNLYIVEQTLTVPGYFKGKMMVHSIHQLMVYVIFWFFLVLSYAWFVLGLFDVLFISYTLPLLFVWYVSYLVYTTQLMSAQAAERSFNSKNIFVSFIMYFTYAQLFSYLFVRSLIFYLKAKKNKQVISWDKTSRFKSNK
ncbi:glycosyltransferase [Halobacillus sp. A1]|uniref:glycosyltransferase family 2 protein n=1 Tax=Halobacillus sp. A1 TaxID=2880262 RepID=UPI0020A6255F|nr:glycosyltransferase [Halobacillus sp. A1]MCP3033069.1 glycosyltransferase [Halobacillus sp. A1]